MVASSSLTPSSPKMPLSPAKPHSTHVHQAENRDGNGDELYQGASKAVFERRGDIGGVEDSICAGFASGECEGSGVYGSDEGLVLDDTTLRGLA